MKWPDICSMLGARCWHARQYRPSSDVMGFRLRGASALSGTMAGPVARSRRSSGRRLASIWPNRQGVQRPHGGFSAAAGKSGCCTLFRLEREGQPLRSESFSALHLQRSRVLASRFGARGTLGSLRAAGWRCGVHDLGLNRLLVERGLAGLGCWGFWLSQPGFQTQKDLPGSQRAPAGSGAASEAC